MKLTSTLVLCWLVPAFLVLAEEPSSLQTVEKWDIFELRLEGPSDGNPFLDVELGATFSDGFREFSVDGFYDGEGVYRVRFCPDRTGSWRYVTRSNVWELTDRQGTFEVTPPGPENHGPVHVFETFHFAYADGTPYRCIGTTAYNWLHRPDSTQELTLQTLAESPFDKLRMLVYPERQGNRTPPEHFPFEGEPPRDWDFNRFNPEYFRLIETRLRQLRDLNIQADLILFHKYGQDWGFELMPEDTSERYLRYIVARWSAFRNVWWSMANEFDFVKTKTTEDWDRYFQIVQAADPYDRLRSIHNGYLIYDHRKPWVTHASIQNGAAVEESGRAQLYRDVWEKPIVYDEVKYEGNLTRRWGNLSGREMVHRFWAGTVAGTYVGHGEALLEEDSSIVWLSTGGLFRGESPERIAFLRKILEEGPANLDPIDKWQDPDTAGLPGEYYLVYFGREAPESWPFQLYKTGVREGQVYEAEIIDTWNMTIDPVPGQFVTTRKDGYHYIDKDGRAVRLPGKPYHAIRLRRVGGGKGIAIEEEPQL
jgi:hypothetical protein